MEGEVAFLARKREFSFQNLSPAQKSNWESSKWSWDSSNFIARPCSELQKKKNSEEESLKLSLGVEESINRPNKRVRSGSPGKVGSFPTCQVDGCAADLSNSKDYHRRHKVCEVHSKTSRAMVGKMLQRFCQQCSRFHVLEEFDEGKRSCRRRLAGHNRRRRKTQQVEESSSRFVLPSSRSNLGDELDPLNLLALFNRLQGDSNDKELLLQILNRINEKSAPKSSGFDLNISHGTDEPETSAIDLVTILSAALKAAGVAALSKLIGGDDESTMNTKKDLLERRQSGADAGPRLQLQLFSSTEEDSPSRRKYLSSGSSNPTADRSQSSSPPIERSLFPLQSRTEQAPKPAEMDGIRRSGGRNPYNSEYPSSSGSDHSPASSHSDGQDRTGRIIFKLFDKDPSDFPPILRAEVLTWLSHSPSDIESYIRPGCVVLSIYLSMPSFAWEELHEDFLQKVTALVQGSESDLWRSGRFLIQTDRRLASHKDGRIRLTKSGRSWAMPELICVSPLAVVGGEETAVVLRGRNLHGPGTRVHCTLPGGGYLSKELASPAWRASTEETCEEPVSVDGFIFSAGLLSDHLGRCFIEVENGLNGSSFPLIVADEAVCRELCLLEPEIEAEPRSREDAFHFLQELGWLFQRRQHKSPLSTDFSSTRFKFLLAFTVDRDWVAVMKKILDDLVVAHIGDRNKEILAMITEIQLLHRAVKRRCRKMVDFLLHFSVSDKVNDSKFFPFLPDAKGRGGLSPLHLAASLQGADDVVDALTSDPLQKGLACWASSVDDNGETPYDYAAMRGNYSYNKLVAGKMADFENKQVSITIVKGSGAAMSCTRCAAATRMKRTKLTWGPQGLLQRPYVHSMLAIAAVCVCVCLFLRGAPELGSVAPFQWEHLGVGTM